MENRKDIERKIDETLDVLNRIQKTGPKPFFYTRLKARMENSAVKTGSPGYKVRYALYAVILLLTINGFSVYKALEWRGDYQEEVSIDNFIDNYYIDIDEINLLSENEIEQY